MLLTYYRIPKVYFPPRKPGFSTRLFLVRFTMDKVALGQFFCEYFVFLVVIIPSVLRTISFIYHRRYVN